MDVEMTRWGRRAWLAAWVIPAAAHAPPKKSMTNLYQFLGDAKGAWAVTSITPYRGAGLGDVKSLDVVNGEMAAPPVGTVWALKGFTSNVRYATGREVRDLRARHLAQDERRQIFEESSQHTAIGLEYLPAIARRLHHSRDLGEPFDFLTWFEFAPEHEADFNELLKRLRASKEWSYVEREVDVRVKQK